MPWVFRAGGGSWHAEHAFEKYVYRGALLIRKRTPLGPYRRPVHRVLLWSQEGGRFLMIEVPLYKVLDRRVGVFATHLITSHVFTHSAHN